MAYLPAMHAALRLDRLTRTYPGAARPAVDALSLDLRAGELLALVGASGSGKSTTLRAVAGYELPEAGRVLLTDASGAEREITRLPPERRGFGMVFQHYALFPHLSVEDNVAFGLEARGVRRAERRARARDALAGVGLAGAGPRPVQALSGGEQQRVALARALVIEPPVLLLDEPLSNLDPALRTSTRTELRRMLTARGVTALFVTHDQEDAFAVADRVAILQHGRLLQAGTPEDLYDAPASRAVAAFIGHGVLVAARPAGACAEITLGGATRLVPAAAAPATETTPGRGWSAVLRPEHLALGPADAPDAWPGRVRARRFAGGTSVYDVACGDVLLNVATPDRSAREGDSVGVRVARGPVALVPDDA